MILSISLIIIGFILLIKGADFLIDGASSVAKRFHISDIIIGLTIVSIGTSLPELFISVTSALNGHADMSLGNIIGSNLANTLLVLGMCAIIHDIAIKRETIIFEIPTNIIIAIIFMVLCNVGNDISRNDAIILIVLCVLFILYTIYMSIKNKKDDEEQYEEVSKKRNSNLLKDIICILIGIVALEVGGNFTVNNAVVIAQKFGLSEKIISVTILAIGTSLPELVTGVWASIEKKADIAIGNVLGSCIFNILLIIGVTGIISPINYNISYNKDMIMMIIVSIVLLLFSFIPPKNKVTRKNGIIYVLIYIGYIVSLLV